MSKYDERYTAAGPEEGSTHVRGIIQQINDEKPSKEKKREVVVRPDGSKVVRVTKKRRVVVSESEKRKAGRRSFVFILLGVFAVCFIGIVMLLFRMSQMSGEAYVQSKAEELKQAWGAESVVLLGSGIEGTSFHLSGLVAEFPADSLVQHVELSDISAELDTASFFTRVLTTAQIQIARAEIRLNPDAKQMQMPLFRGPDLWKIRRVECDSVHVKMGDKVSLTDAHSYLYYPRPSDKTVCSLGFSGGVLQLRGMQPIRMSDAKMLLSQRGVEEFYAKGTTDRANQGAGKEHTSLTISGRIEAGNSLAGPFEFDSDGMLFSDFTDGRFGRVLTARTAQQAIGREHSGARILLPLENNAPVFDGEFLLKQISLNGFPMLMMLTEHLEPGKRSVYQPATIAQGRIILKHEGDKLIAELPEHQVEERDLMTLFGYISLNADNDVSGILHIGIPAVLTHAEYADGKADPLFEENAGMAWMTAELNGSIGLPGDNSALLNAQAEEARRTRPGRLNLDEVDFAKVSARIQKDREVFEQSDTPAAPQEDTSSAEPSSPSVPASQRQQVEQELFGTGSLDMGSPLDTKSVFD